MNSKVYKWCAVPLCTNTSIVTPNKIFVHVPNKKTVRDNWLTLARRNPRDVVTNSPIYFCQDHFDLPQDMLNYMQYHVMGSVAQVRMKPECVPTKFECQQDTQYINTTYLPHHISKKRKVLVLEGRLEIEKESTEDCNFTAIVSENSADHSMEMNTGTCLLCFAENVKIYNIIDTHLQYTYEVIAESEVNPDFHTVCYLCHTKLQQCYQLIEHAQNVQVEYRPLVQLSVVNISNIEQCQPLNIKRETEGGVKVEANVEDQEKFEVSDEKSNDFHFDMTEQTTYNENSHSNTSKEKFGNEDNFEVEIQTDTISDSVNEYLEIVSSEKLFSCDICDKKFRQKASVKAHKRIHTGEKPFSCDICHKKYKRKASVKAHRRTHTGEKPFSCEICDMKFNQKHYLSRHMLRHTGDKPVSCDVCGKRFSQKSTLNKHKLTHTGEKPHSCEICGKTFGLMGQLIKHRLVHTDYKAFSCDVCERTFSRKDYLTRHIVIHSSDKPHSCDICQMRFYRKSTLRKHKLIHTGEKPFSCNICNKKFTHNDYLTEHMVTHTTGEQFSCSICGMKYNRKNSMRKHMSTHSNKQISCDICNMQFTLKSALNKHKTIHTDDKPYQCDMCDKKFRLKEYLRIHTLTHSGEKPYSCDLCDKKFRHKYDCKKHMLTHTAYS